MFCFIVVEMKITDYFFLLIRPYGELERASPGQQGDIGSMFYLYSHRTIGNVDTASIFATFWKSSL